MKRKSKIVSKSQEMFELSIKLEIILNKKIEFNKYIKIISQSLF
jgi:hypothetical protein